MGEEFLLDIISVLNEQVSKRKIKEQLKGMDNSMFIKVISKLSIGLSQRQLKKDLKQLNDLYLQVGADLKIDSTLKKKLQGRIKTLQDSISDLQIGVRAKDSDIVKTVAEARNKGQRVASKSSIDFNIEVKREKAIADLEYMAKKYSKLFSNASASSKYNNILDAAYGITDAKQLSNVRAQTAAFTSELKANGLASQSLGDKWKRLIDRAKDLFSAASAVTLIISQVRQAVSSFLQLDTAMTNLYKVQDQITSRDQFSGLLTKWNKLAQNLAVTTNSLISSMEAWSKIGFNLDMSEQLAEITSIFEKTAEISNEKATSTLISAAQAFTEIDDLGVDDYVKRVEAVGNKINAIGNKYAIDSEGIADGLQNASAALKVAGNDLNETIALITATNKIYQNPEEGSNMLKVASMRLRGQVDALKEMGEDAEGVSTDLTKIQQQVYELTGNKVNIFEDEDTLKSTYQIILEIGEVFDSLNDRSQADLLEKMFGKQRVSAGASLLLNYEELEKIKNDSINSANSMAEEYSKYMESAEAHITIFKEKLIETYSTFMSGDVIKYTADMGSGLLDLVNATDLLRHSLVGIVSLNIGKGITSIGASIASTVKQFNMLGSALQQVKNLPVDSSRVDILEQVGNATKSLTEKNLKLLLSQKQLKDSDKETILRMHDLTDEEAQLKLQKLGLLSVTKSQTTANVAEATTTGTLKNAMLSLKTTASDVGATIKGMFASNPIGMGLMLATTAISMFSTAISKHNEKLEEARQINIESATTASENANRLKDLYNEYTRLSAIQDRTISEEESFKTAVENITVALGNKAKALENLIAGTDEYADALARVAKEELQSQAVTATIGRKSAEEELQNKIWSDWSGSQVSIDSNSKGKALSDEAQKAVGIVSESLKEFETINRTWKNISWDITSNDPTEALEYYNSLVEAREKLVLASENDESLLDTEIYEDLNTAINSMSESLDTYIEKLYEEEKLNYMAQNSIPSTTEEYKAMETALVNVAGSSVDLQDKFKGLLMSDFSDLATNIETVKDAVEDVTTQIENVKNIDFDQAWADSFTSEDENVKELGNALLELAEKGRLTVDTFNEADSTEYFKNLGISADIAVSKINKLVDESKQLSSMSDQISKMSEALGTKRENGFVEADTLSGFDVEVRGLESWDKFQTVLGSTTSSYQECQEAANALATEWVNSSDFLAQLTEDTKEYYETQLEAMGVENYEEVIESTLALKEAKEALLDVDLSSASYEDIEALIQEGEYSALVTEQMWALYYAKLAESETFLDSSADCAQLQALANDAMLTAEAVELLNQLIQIYNGLESGAYNNNRALREEAIEEASRIKSELENLAKGEGEGLIVKPELKVKGNNGKKSGGSSKSSKDLWKEQYEKNLKDLEHMHKLDLISDEEYWKARMDLNEKYFGESSGMHEKYLEEYQENEEDILEGLKKLWEDYYDERKNNLKDLISYAGKLYDREIDSLEASIKALEEKRDAEKKIWQDKIDAIGDEIDALEDANDQRERAINLQEKQWALQKAMHQRTMLLYSESNGMHYVNDIRAERDAKNDLDSAEHDNKVADLKKQQKDLEKQLDAILETYDAQIEAIEKQIDSLKEVKSAWSDIVENQEFKELEEKLKSLFGDDVKEKILSGNTDFINSIISQYSDTSDMLRTIEDATLADIQNMVAQYGILPENLMPVTDAISDIADVMGNVDTSGFNTNLDNTAQSSSNMAEKVESAATALNNLSNEVSSYQLPELNTDNFISAFSEDGGIISALNSFMERYKEICDGIPEIWNNSLAEAFGQGGGNGDPLAGGLANDTKYDALFDPLVEALNNCRTNMEAKLKECLETFTTFQADLSGIIGVGGGGDSEDSGSSQSGAEGGKGKGSGGEKGSGGDKKSESGGGSDTIVGAIVEGGALIDQALNGEEDSWNASFITAAESIHNTATYIVECIESMVETIVNACIAAIEAINMLERAQGGAGNHPTPPPYSRVGHTHGEIGDAFADGTGLNGTTKAEKNAIVSEYGQREMTVFPNGKTVLTDTPTGMDMPKGTVVYNEEQTEKILKNKVTATGSAYAKGTSNVPVGEKFVLADGTVLTPVPYDDPAYDVTRKFEAYMEKTGNDIDIIARSGLIRYNNDMGEVVKNVTNVSNVTNNNRNMQPVIHQEIHVTLPNVTNATSAESLLRDLESIGRKKYQVNW